MNKTITFSMFVLGAVVGSAVTWRFIEKKYEQIARDEINSVKEVFSKRDQNIGEDDVKEKPDKVNSKEPMTINVKEKPNVVEYTNKLRERGYINYSDVNPENKKENKKDMTEDQPYVIPPEDFGELDDYEKISLTYYADRVLADDNDELVENVEDIVGFESLDSFGEYEYDSVFVRNDRLKCDYEILLDQREFSDVVKKKPYKE